MQTKSVILPWAAPLCSQGSKTSMTSRISSTYRVKTSKEHDIAEFQEKHKTVVNVKLPNICTRNSFKSIIRRHSFSQTLLMLHYYSVSMWQERKSILFRICCLRKTTKLLRIWWDIVYFIDRIIPLLDISCMGQKKFYSEMFFKVAKQKAGLSYYYSSQ